MKWQLVQFLLKQAGVDKRTGDLYGNRDLLNIARNMARGLKGVENVYIQHQPLLFQTMESIIKGRLRDVDYPFVGNHFQQGRPQDVVIFIVGGTTYEESRSVALQNASISGIRFILGGSAVLNSKRLMLSWLDLMLKPVPARLFTGLLLAYRWKLGTLLHPKETLVRSISTVPEGPGRSSENSKIQHQCRLR
ncbi:vacuolar protein sorting 45 [Populus alba x Populus x berolinensis]|nr:vacuolar protein sorting 45 [Populus alba x Populus x berolinensis]